jgi:TonB family protein
MNARALFFACAVGFLAVAVEAQAADYLNNTGVAAVDANGVRHFASEYRGKNSPWIVDCIMAVGPDYTYDERRRHHTGTGSYRLFLDLKTGYVTKVQVLKSTGFDGLDDSAIAAFRQWRWRPGRWKEVDTSVTFTIGSSSPRQPSSIRLPTPSPPPALSIKDR